MSCRNLVGVGRLQRENEEENDERESRGPSFLLITKHGVVKVFKSWGVAVLVACWFRVGSVLVPYW